MILTFTEIVIPMKLMFIIAMMNGLISMIKNDLNKEREKLLEK